MTHRERVGAGLATLIAGLGWLSLVIDGTTVVGRELGHGASLPQALFLWLRYFTILTNIGVAALMTATVVRAARRLPPPAAPWYAAALAYILVVCVTYEVILRQGWRPAEGVPFLTDLTFHDIVPALTLVYWIGYTPKRGLTWRFPLSLMIYPSIWFVVTLVAGALGESYPYSFVDVSKLGYPVVMLIGVMFLAIYYALGAAMLTAARGGRSDRPRNAERADEGSQARRA